MQPPVQLLFQLPSTVQQQQSSSQQQPVQIQPVGQLIEPKDPKSEPPQTSILSVVQTPIQLGLIEQQNVQMHGPNGNGGLQGLHANQLQNVNFQDTQQDTAFYPDRHHHFPAVGHPHYIQNNSQVRYIYLNFSETVLLIFIFYFSKFRWQHKHLLW